MEDQEKLFENASRFVSQKGISRFTRYLDPAQAIMAGQTAKAHGVLFSHWGGYNGAERVIGCFHTADESVNPSDFPLVCLYARFASKFCQLTHRDLLGAFMSLGLTRDCIGDIIILSDRVYLFAIEQTADFIAASLTSAGRASLSFTKLDLLPDIPAPSGTSFSAVVSSLRLDAVLAASYKLSRGEASEAIRAGLVKVNHIAQDRADILLKEDTLLSLRGRGRVRFVSVDGATRKQRIGITLFRYE